MLFEPADVMGEGDPDALACWICLGSDGDLVSPCACPRAVHARCLARWQLQQAGRDEEVTCRFCGGPQGDWREQMGPTPKATPIMAVTVGDHTRRIRVQPGLEGKEAFRRKVRHVLGYAETEDFDVVFECTVPLSGERVRLAGFGAFNAAYFCAAVSAERRVQRKRTYALMPMVEHRPNDALPTADAGPFWARASGGDARPLPADYDSGDVGSIDLWRRGRPLTLRSASSGSLDTAVFGLAQPALAGRLAAGPSGPTPGPVVRASHALKRLFGTS